MEIVNLESIRKESLKVTVSIGKTNIYFTKKAVEKYSILKGRRVTFLTELDRLYFIISDDPHGVKIFTSNGDGAKICGKAMTKALVRKLPNLLKSGHVFPLKELNSEVQGNKLIEVLIHKKP